MRTWNEEKKQWVGMKGDGLCEGSRICKCSLIAGNVVPNPECPVHVEVVEVAPSRSAAPPIDPHLVEAAFAHQNLILQINKENREKASAAPPREREVFEKWARSKGLSCDRLADALEYADLETAMAWSAWKARRQPWASSSSL